jgi:hypothetical protein
MNNHLIKQLQEGKIAVHNDGTLEELREVLQYAFPKDNWTTFGGTIYYISSGGTHWISTDKTNLPSFSVKEFLKEETMEKKIIGYKLTKPEYEKAANQITGTENLILHSQNYNFQIDTIAYDRVVKAGVLDLWFEPVYEEEKFKVGDWVTTTTEIANCYEKYKKGEVFQLTEIQCEYVYFSPRQAVSKDRIRKATEEEIKKAQIIELPKINGYHGKIEGDFLVYGCAKFAIRNIKDLCEDILSFNNPDERLEKYSGGNRIITSIQLSSGVTMTTTHLEIILKYLNQKGL